MEKEEKTRRDGGEEREKLPGERTDAPRDPRSTSATSGAFRGIHVKDTHSHNIVLFKSPI